MSGLDIFAWIVLIILVASVIAVFRIAGLGALFALMAYFDPESGLFRPAPVVGYCPCWTRDCPKLRAVS
jgi:hypothetical protein